MIRVADYFVRYLADRQVDTAFLVSGGMMMHLMDAVAREPRISYYCNFHEQASAMAADAFARVTGRAALCLATGGPGGTNLLTGLVGAWQDSIPIVFLTGQSKLCDTVRGNNMPGLRQYGMFEVDLIPIVQSVTKYAAFVDRAANARLHMEKAFHLATTGRPGPVLLDVPLDIQGALINPDCLQGYEEQAQPLVLSDQRVERVLTQLRAAKKPLLWAGHGVRCSGSVESFRTLVDRLGIPVLTTPLAKDLLPYEHPLFVGHPGIKGNRAANLALNETDLLIVIGSSLHGQNIGWEPELFVPGACKIHVDPDWAILQKTKAIVTEQIQADVGVFVAAMSCLLEAHNHETSRYRLWRERCQTFKTGHTPMSEGHQLGRADGPANLYEVIDILSDELPAETIVISDAGQPTYAVPQAWRSRSRHRYLAPGSLAEMGWALPAAIGAAAAAPGTPIVVIVGDGSLQTNIQELQTIRHYDLNVKIVVINNDGYASIRSAPANNNATMRSKNWNGSAGTYASIQGCNRLALADRTRSLRWAICKSCTRLAEADASPDAVSVAVFSTACKSASIVASLCSERAMRCWFQAWGESPRRQTSKMGKSAAILALHKPAAAAEQSVANISRGQYRRASASARPKFFIGMVKLL